MVSSFITFLPLLLVLNANAVIKEPGLRKFCSHQALAVPDGLKTTTRHKNDFCEQKFHYEATSETDAKATCRYFAPFEQQLAEKDGKTVKCQWKSRTTCENSQHTLINEVCFHLGYPGKAGDARARCLHGSTLHRVTDPEQSRWITFLLGKSDALHVANTAGDTSESMKYDNKTWVGSDFINETTTTQPRALQMRRNDLHDVPAGKIVTVADFVELRVLCSKPAVEYQGPPSVTNTMHFPDHMRPPQVGGRAVLRTSNVYQAIATSETDIDTMVFHRICQNMCKKCFAALPDMTAELAKLGQMSLVASRYSPQGAPVRKNNECKKDIAISVLEDQFESQTPNGKVGGVEKSSWKSQYPDNMCADTPRVAVRAGTGGKLKDVPAISRHRLLCIIGSEPGVTARSFCRPESAIQKPDGSCECKPDFLDIIDIAGVANKERFVKGQVCIAKKPCDSITKTVAIVFQIDTRNEWKQVKKFMKSASKSLPSEAKLGFVHLSKTGWQKTKLESWDEQSLSATVESFAEPDSSLDSKDGLDLNSATAELTMSLTAEMKYIIWMTDIHIRPGARVFKMNANVRKWLKVLKAKQIVVPVKTTSQNDVNTKNNLLALETRAQDPEDFNDLSAIDLSKLSSKHWAKVMSSVCHEPTWEDFKKAIAN